MPKTLEIGQTQRQAFLTVRVQPPRGTILDRYGRPLVINSAATVVQLWPSDLPKVYTLRYAELSDTEFIETARMHLDDLFGC